MATFYGADIAGAANAEERALERALNLGLANRQFRAVQDARGRDDALQAASLARAIQSANVENQIRLANQEEARRQFATQVGLSLLGQREQSRQFGERQRLNREELEAGERLAAQREGAVQTAEAQQRTAQEQANLVQGIQSRIGAEITSLRDFENYGGRKLPPPAQDTLLRDIAAFQSRMRSEPAAFADTANQQWANSAENNPALPPDQRRNGFAKFAQKIQANKNLGPYVRANYETLTFEPSATATKFPTDAIEFFRQRDTGSSPNLSGVARFASNVIGGPAGLIGRLVHGVEQDSSPPRAPTPQGAPAANLPPSFYTRVSELQAAGVPLRDAVRRATVEQAQTRSPFTAVFANPLAR